MTSTPGSAVILVRPEFMARMRQHFESDPSISVFDASEVVPPVNIVSARAQMLLVTERVFAERLAGARASHGTTDATGADAGARLRHRQRGRGQAGGCVTDGRAGALAGGAAAGRARERQAPRQSPAPWHRRL